MRHWKTLCLKLSAKRESFALMTLTLKGTLVLVGAGKMGGAMLEGWLKAGADPKRIVALDPGPPPEVLALLVQHSIRHNPPIDTVDDAEVVLVAVKPQMMDDVLAPFAGLAQSKPLVLSVVAGKTIAKLAAHFGHNASIIRTMPNTPAAIGRGITAMVGNAHVTPSQMALAEQLLSTIGEVVRVDTEEQIDWVTGVSGSGPAYIFLLTECLAAAGEKLGLSPKLAEQLARATVSGSGELMRLSGTDAATLRKNVTSPKGTTYEALQILMAEDGLKPLMEKAVAAAARRSKELAG
jgi:pyrroline-5-carboxylate reductase